MIGKELLIEIFKAAYMQRWNDHLRPVELLELDKQAHKMIVAYILAKHEEETGTKGINWQKIIEGGIFEFLQRIVITDIKPPLFYKIKQDSKKYAKLNIFVYDTIAPMIENIENGAFLERFKLYLDSYKSDDINRFILQAAHLYASRWEFEIIERANPKGYEISKIREELDGSQEKTYQLKSMKHLMLSHKIKDFADLCGELRFQVRWNHLHRIPKTSVLGHMLIVAMITYFFSLETGACSQRLFNNYFTALFHDLPEVLTRDIISPVKKSVRGLDSFIKKYEQEEMQKIYALLPKTWHSQIHMFTANEFASIVTIKGKTKNVSSDMISVKYNRDVYNGRDGQIVEIADKLAAFTEAYLSLKNGINNQELKDAAESIEKNFERVNICGISMAKIMSQF